MGAAFFIVLEKAIDGLDTMMDGKCLSRVADELDEAATELGVRPISEFISTDPAQAAEFLEGEGVDVSTIKLPPLQQFPADEGLATVRALMDHIQANAGAIPRADGVLQDLHECERILSVAAEHGVGWHLEVDF